ncbi:MAG: hypothetical protein HKN23_21705 [Verrucomicrobiales bacterium]|nr:hypothetical protein [Verrucomicrobiales bacterium]
MKTNFLSKKRRVTKDRGSILVVCMVLAGLGTIGVAAWAALLDARSHAAEQALTALDRSVIFDNSLALGREVIYRKYLHAAAGPAADDEKYAFADGWGTIELDSWTQPVLGYIDSTRVQKTGAVPFRAFSLDVNCGIADGNTVHDFTYQLKSYSPILAGDLVVLQKNRENGGEGLELTGDVNVEGRVVYWAGDYEAGTASAKTDAALFASKNSPKTALADTSGKPILPSNFPFPAMTSGSVAGNPNFDGQYEVVDNSSTPSNSYFHKVVAFGSGSYVSFDGSVPAGSGEGIDSNPVTPNDPTVAAIIASGMYTPANLEPYAPLSSNNLAAVIADDTLSPSELVSVMTTNQPLPDDILDDVVGSPYFSDADQTAVLEGAGYHAYVYGGEMVVNLNSATIPHILATNVTDIDFIGQPDPSSADALKNAEPRIVALKNDPGVVLRTIDCSNLNSRRVIFAAQNQRVAITNACSVAFTGASGFPDWHIIMELSGIRTKWNTSAVGGVRIYGGIRSDQQIDVFSGALSLRKQTNFTSLETMLSRTAWIETVRK